MKIAALDLGSNTFLCLIAEVSGTRVTHVYEDLVEVVRLGQGLGKGDNSSPKIFHQDALIRARACLQRFQKKVQEHKVQASLGMATAAAREVTNAQALLEIGKELGFPIEIIPGDREAEISFQGATSGLQNNQESLAVVDVGGGSTELIFGKGGQIRQEHSFPLGCVRLTEHYFSSQPPSQAQLQAVAADVDRQLAEVLRNWPSDQFPSQILAVAGTPTELARLEIGGVFSAEKIDQVVLSRETLKKWQDRFLQSRPGEIQTKWGVQSGRADVILVGTTILLQVLKALQLPALQVSSRGVRYGVALELARRLK